MSEQGMTREEFMAATKIESLARQNAQQAVRIADLESQLSLAQIELNSLKNQQETVPGEQPVEPEVAEDLGDPPH